MEVCPLARGMMLPLLNPYPSHYKRAFAFSILLYPHSHRLTLQFAFLIASGEVWVYHVSHKYQDGLGSAFPPVVLHLRQLYTTVAVPDHLPFWFKPRVCPRQHLWLVVSDDVYQRFTFVNHTIRP